MVLIGLPYSQLEQACKKGKVETSLQEYELYQWHAIILAMPEILVFGHRRTSCCLGANCYSSLLFAPWRASMAERDGTGKQIIQSSNEIDSLDEKDTIEYQKPAVLPKP
ncbi:hypothetical protein [Rhizobium sp. NLR4a]|uniref:hypothetical protein n=1 Tax=Rhizobium sp. NLR4a TaxID=2731117 RepID=UPI001C834768|nr:hypothetical protein [Rhizobium sp. NLR4a]